MAKSAARAEMDIESLAIFAAVAETASFTRGAARVFRSQPVASNRIARLERVLGTRLFDRAGQAARLTACGQALYGYARRILALQAEAAEAVAREKGGLTGELAIGASTIPAAYLVPRLAARFHRKFPQVRLRVLAGPTADIVRRVREGELDLGVVGDRPPSRDAHSAAIPGDEIVLAVPRGHPLARGTGRLTPERLKGAPLVLRAEGSGTRAVLERALARARISLSRDFDVVCEVTSTESARQAVEEGVGLSFLSSLAVSGTRACGKLVVRRLSGIDLTRPFHLVTPNDRKLSRAAHVFAGIVRKSAGDSRRV